MTGQQDSAALQISLAAFENTERTAHDHRVSFPIRAGDIRLYANVHGIFCEPIVYAFSCVSPLVFLFASKQEEMQSDVRQHIC